MERIQFVQEAIREIVANNHEFFQASQIDIYESLTMERSLHSNWINVMVKENSQLPPNIIKQIKDKFGIID